MTNINPSESSTHQKSAWSKPSIAKQSDSTVENVQVNTRSRCDDPHHEFEWTQNGIVRRAGPRNEWIVPIFKQVVQPIAPPVMTQFAVSRPSFSVCGIEEMCRNPGPSSDWSLDDEQFGLLTPFSGFQFNKVQCSRLPDFSTFGFDEVRRSRPPVVEPVAPVVEPIAPVVEEEWQTVGPKVKKQATKPATKAKKQGSKPMTEQAAKPMVKQAAIEKQNSKKSAAIHQTALISAQDQLITECIGQISRDTCANVVTNMTHTINYKKSMWLKFSDDDVVSQVDGIKHTFSRAHFFGNYAFQQELRERFEPLLPGAWIKIFPGGTKHTFCLAVTRARREA